MDFVFGAMKRVEPMNWQWHGFATTTWMLVH